MNTISQVILRPSTQLPEKPHANQFIEFAHPLDIFQHHSCISIDNGEHTLVTAHTGSGKTVIAKYAIINAVKTLKKKVIYTSPIKTLSNQKYAEFRKDLEQYEIEVGLMTGDNKINVEASCIIMTTEILRNMLYYSNNGVASNIINLQDVACVIFDEVHYINDVDRGKVWEECITMLSKDIMLVMLSATIENSFEFASWIKNIKDKNVNLITTNRRIIPLMHYVFTKPYELNKITNKKVGLEEKLFLIKDNEDNFFDETYHTVYTSTLLDQEANTWKHRLNALVGYLQKHDMNQTIFFVLSREGCETCAKSVPHTLIDTSDMAEVNHWFNYMFKSFEATYGKLEQVTTVKNLLMKGIAFHHSGLIPILKEIIEIIFQKGLIRILFATETFAVGVNMPTRTVVFTSMTKPDNISNKRLLYTSEYVQMAGRAGRRGIDTFGNCIILPLKEELPIPTEMKSLMLGKGLCLESKFKIDYNFILKALNSSNDINQVIRNTLYNHDIQKSITFQKQQVDNKLIALNEYNFSTEDINKIKEYRKIELDFQNLKQKKPNKKKQFKINMMPLYENKELYEKYKSYEIYLTKLNDYNKSLENLENLNDDINNQIMNIKLFLHQHGYLTLDKNSENSEAEVNKFTITSKGILIAHINECDPALLLAEMITQKIFDDVTKSEDIVAILSIFLNGIRPDLYYGNLLNNDKHDTKIIKNKFIKIEKILESFNNLDHVALPFHYVEMVYYWVLGYDLQETLSSYNTYEGNFIHCMIKMNNIVAEVIKVCKMINYLDIIPRLECIEALIMRDIVSPVSLYL